MGAWVSPVPAFRRFAEVASKIMKIVAIIAALVIQGCIFSQKDEGVCGEGEYEFTRYNKYDERDSLISTIVVDAKGDTTTNNLFEYDSEGFLRREIWIHTFDGINSDTSCLVWKRQENESIFVSSHCSDTTRKFSIKTLNAMGKASNIGYYSGTTIFLELFLTYNPDGNPIQAESILNGEKFVSAKSTYYEDGNWKTTEEFDRNGALKTIFTNEFISSNRTKVKEFDGKGSLLRWEFGFLNGKRKPEKFIACKAG